MDAQYGGSYRDPMTRRADDLIGDLTGAELDELAELAERSEGFDPFADDVVALRDPGAPPTGLLPEWYMPAPSNRIGRGRRFGLAALALGFVVVNVGGFCVTYGLPEWVWKG